MGIDRMNGSGDTAKSQTWDKIKNRYSKYLKVEKQEDDEKKIENSVPKTNKITVNINENPSSLQGQQQRCRYYRWYNDRVPDMVENGFYEVSDKNGNGQNIKIKVEKILKKSYKKTKLYHQAKSFKFLTPKILDSVYRNHENMEINIVNDTSLNCIYRLQANKENKSFKKLCILNVYGENNGFAKNSTLSHSLSRYDYNISDDQSDAASKYLYTSAMVYSPNCIIFRDLNEEMTANYFKVSFITAHAVNLSEYNRIKKKMFNAPEMEKRLKALDEKANNVKSGKKFKHHNNNKSDKKRQAENEEFIAKLQEMEDVIDCIMRDRIRRMIEIAIFNGFGCNNDYGNDVKKIADIFAELMQSIYFNCFKSVNFAIKEPEDYYRRRYVNSKNEELKMYKFKIFQDAFRHKIA